MYPQWFHFECLHLIFTTIHSEVAMIFYSDSQISPGATGGEVRVSAKSSMNQWKLWPAGGATGRVRGSPMLLERILKGPWISKSNFIPVHLNVATIFYSKSQISTSWCSWRRRGTVFRVHPLGTLNVCTKFHGNSSNNGFSVRTEVAGRPTDRRSKATSIAINSKRDKREPVKGIDLK